VDVETVERAQLRQNAEHRLAVLRRQHHAVAALAGQMQLAQRLRRRKCHHVNHIHER
jgi:hypothetical protein